MRTGYCSRCRHWLGDSLESAEKKEVRSSSETELEWQNWIFNAVGELLATAPSLSTLPGKEKLALNLSFYIDSVAGGGQAQFSRCLQAHHADLGKLALWRWKAGSQPTFRRLLQVCYCLQTTPLDFLTKPPKSISAGELKSLPAQTARASVQKTFNQLDLDQLRQALEAVLVSDEEPPSSLNQIAKQLGYSDHTALGRRLPELSRAVSARYRAYRSRRSLERKQLIEDEVRQRTFEIHAEGRYPSFQQVTPRLSKPRYALDPKVKAVWSEAVQKLGYVELKR